MTAWEYGELLTESVTVSDNGEWVTKGVITWHGPNGMGNAVTGSSVYGLNWLGVRGWELVGVTRNQIESEYQIKVITTYTVRRPMRRRPRRGVSADL
jgi:hypothetical protein